MIIHRLLVNLLVTSTLHWMEVLGQDGNDTHPIIGPRVVGGSIVTSGELGGYIVAMRYDDFFVCGGTLIHELIVISAAHCFENARLKEHWVVEGSVSTLTDIGIRRRIKEYLRPRVFSMKLMDWDVAVVLLDRPMVGKGIGKLSLCTKPLSVGSISTVAGFGMVTSAGTGPDHYLRKTTVPIVSKELCRRAYLGTGRVITDNMLCASELGKRDACTYDSGGPLVYENQLCGIVSFGVGCASSIYPGVYADVFSLTPYIKSVINILLSDNP